jgi:RHS repeat-associated protein
VGTTTRNGICDGQPTKQPLLLNTTQPVASLITESTTLWDQSVNISPDIMAVSPSQSLLGFNGERQDTVLGGYPLGNGYRLYNPALRRFTAPDSMSPFGQGGINPYAYCEGDPINHTDPTGHFGIAGGLNLIFMGLMDIAPEGGEAVEAADEGLMIEREPRRAGRDVEHIAACDAERAGADSASASDVTKWTNAPSKRYVLQIGEGNQHDLTTFNTYVDSTRYVNRIPEGNIFGEIANAFPDSKFTSISTSEAPLSVLDKSSRLDIVMHGNRHGGLAMMVENGRRVERIVTPRKLAETLKNYGLSEVGVIKLHSCRIGSGAFPKQLSNLLSSYNIQHGFISAPEGYTTIAHFFNKRLSFPTGIAVQKGDLDVIFEGTRYT